MELNIAASPEPQTSTQPISDIVQSIEPKKSHRKWLAVIIGAIVLIIVILIILFSPFFLLQIALNKLPSSKMAVNSVSPTPVITIAPAEIDQSTGWKIYNNSSDYSFEYPSSWNEVTSVIPEDREFHSRDYSENANILPVINKGISLTIEAGIDPMFTNYNDYKNYVEKINKSKPQEILVDNQKCLFYSNSGPILGAYVSECTMFLDRKKYHLAFENVTKDNSLFKQILSTFKFTSQTSQNSQAEQKYLDIPEFGVKLPLSENISDAYYVTSPKYTNFVYLKVHSLDNEPQCKSDDSSTAALTRVGKDEINQMDNKKYSERYSGTTIGNYFYFIDLAQYVCAESSKGITKLDSVRKAFQDASQTIESL